MSNGNKPITRNVNMATKRKALAHFFVSRKDCKDFEIAFVLAAILPPMVWGCAYIIYHVVLSK